MSEIDENLLQINLEMSPMERILAHQAALNLVWEIENSRNSINEES